MSFFTEIKIFIKTEVLGIEEINTTQKIATKRVNTPIIQTKVDAPIDKFETKNHNKKAEKVANNSQKALEKSLENIPTEHFDINKMIRKGLLEKITGKNKEDFKNLSPKEFQQILFAVKTSIEKFETLKKEGKINPSTSEEELIQEYSKILYEALKTGAYQNIEEFKETVGDINKDLGPKFFKAKRTEQRLLLKEQRIKDNLFYEAELRNIDKLPEHKRKAARMRAEIRFRYRQRGRHLDLLAQANSEIAAHSQIILPSKDMEYGSKILFQSRCNDAERTKTADYMTYDFTKGMIADYKSCVDDVQAESLQAYTAAHTQYKSSEAMYEYQNAYTQDRNLYEKALNKQANGEVLTPEEEVVLAIMQPELYTAAAKGIGSGVLNNINMTTQEKAEFIVKWDNDAKKYNDYNNVVTNIIKEIESNPEYKELKVHVEKVREKIINEQKQNASNTNTSYKKRIDDSSYNLPNNSSKVLKPINTDVSSLNRITKNIHIRKNEIKHPVETGNSEIILKNISNTIQTQGIGTALQEYKKEDIVEAVISNKSLSYAFTSIKHIIKGFDFNTINNIAKNCSESAFTYICNLRPESEVTKLIENRKHSKALSYNTQKNIEYKHKNSTLEVNNEYNKKYAV